MYVYIADASDSKTLSSKRSKIPDLQHYYSGDIQSIYRGSNTRSRRKADRSFPVAAVAAAAAVVADLVEVAQMDCLLQILFISYVSVFLDKERTYANYPNYQTYPFHLLYL